MRARFARRPVLTALLGGAVSAAALVLASSLLAHAAPAKGPTPIPPAQGAPTSVPAVAGIPPVAVPDTVKITIVTLPSSVKKVFVNWGKKRLGIIAPKQPLIIQRPRDSGPLDLLLTADGYVPVQTRAYTFADTKVSVKLTPVDQKNTLLGYREELPPSVPDGGALPPGAPAVVPTGLPPTIAAPGSAAPAVPVPGNDAGVR